MMFDRLQYYFLKTCDFVEFQIKKAKYNNDRPTNKQLAEAEKLEMKTTIGDPTSETFRRLSYSSMYIYSRYKGDYVVMKTKDLRKLFDENDNVIWEKSVEL